MTNPTFLADRLSGLKRRLRFGSSARALVGVEPATGRTWRPRYRGWKTAA